MKTYLVFEPQAGNRTPEEAERVVFLREKFSWPAFAFGPECDFHPIRGNGRLMIVGGVIGQPHRRLACYGLDPDI